MNTSGFLYSTAIVFILSYSVSRWITKNQSFVPHLDKDKGPKLHPLNEFGTSELEERARVFYCASYFDVSAGHIRGCTTNQWFRKWKPLHNQVKWKSVIVMEQNIGHLVWLPVEQTSVRLSRYFSNSLLMSLAGEISNQVFFTRYLPNFAIFRQLRFYKKISRLLHKPI